MALNAFVLNVLYAFSLAMNMFVIAAGLSLIFGVLRVINFAHGAFYMVGAYIMYSVTKLGGGGFWLGVLAAGLGMGAIALAIERGLLRFLYGKEHLMQLLFSFAIVLLMGDNLNDFAEVFETRRTVESRIAAVEQNRNLFGTKFIVLPNPMYGDWENSIYDYNFKLTSEEKQAKRRALLKD